MKPSIAALFLIAVAMAGCTQPAPTSPLFAPKLVVDLMEDGAVQLFVHSAFGERAYERIVLGVDNVTVTEANDTHAALAKVQHLRFFLEVEAQPASREEGAFTFQGLIDVREDGSGVDVAILGENGWSEARSYSRLPYEHIMDRRTT